MEKYIEGNKAAWEEAFENRDASWGNDITERFASNKVLERCGFIKEGTI